MNYTAWNIAEDFYFFEDALDSYIIMSNETIYARWSGEVDSS